MNNLSLPALLGLSLLASCTQASHASDEGRPVTKAIAVLYPTEGSEVSGTVTFTQGDGGILIEAELSGLTPGKHGFHVHELGDVSAADGTSAGGHFNPHEVDHAHPEATRHVGDMGNLEADESGRATYARTDALISFDGRNSILGRAVVVHAAEDDGGQPTGNAGGRVAIGVVGIAAEGSSER